MRRNLIFVLYRILQIAAFPLILLHLALRGPRYRRSLPQRLGALTPSFQRTSPDSIWLHAVSVGEVLSCIELVQQLRGELPGSSLFVSCGTLSGREAAEAKLAGLVDGIFFAPLDFVFAVRRVLRRLRPAVVIILETEIWPNLYREVRRSGAGLVVVNGRISSKAGAAYRKHRWFFSQVLSLPHRILAQSEADRQHYLIAGAPAKSVVVSGNLKYDFRSGGSLALDLRRFLEEPGRLLVAASTGAPEFPGDVDEDEAVIAAWGKLPPDVRLLIAPRRPERFDVVAQKLRAAGVDYVRRTQLPGVAKVLLLDSVGELGAVFPFADVVFMGGTLAQRGGHNFIEPALCGKPVVVGPHLENFAAVQKVFREGNGFLEIAGAVELASAVSRLLVDDGGVGERGRLLAESQRGATARAVTEIVKLRWQAIPLRVVHWLPALQLLSLFWKWGGYWKRRSAKVMRLRTPVVSVGGLAMGGVGKTPMVLHLAKLLPGAAVLTRGYRRRSGSAVNVFGKGDSAPIELTGDEAQLFLRSGLAVGIGADRYAAGLEMERRFRPGVLLLDDGFQHARLHRDFDLVLLDGLDPLSGGLFPIGWMREPCEALRRADAIVITRSDGRRYDGLLRELRSSAVSAPAFYSSVVVEPLRIQGSVTAFCQLANPETFRLSLRELGISVEDFVTFPDHHRYSNDDLQRLVNAGHPLVTTEKDAMNLPPDWPRGNLHVLRISIRIDNEDALLALIMEKCNARSRQESSSS